MYKPNKHKCRSYFYITEDPPVSTHQNLKTTLKHPKSKQNSFFFIDFTDNCNLRLMTKVANKDKDYQKPLSIEKYGSNIVTNIEDSSAGEQKLAKFQEESTIEGSKKKNIRLRVKKSLDKQRQKIKSHSVFTLKKDLADFYANPMTIDYDRDISKTSKTSLRDQHKEGQVLKRLGLQTNRF